MVATPFKRNKKGYGNGKERRFHKVVPFIENPCEGADYENAVFSQRHEANHDELCFDLFFVANLATFTAYHTITDYLSLLSYIGFFAILWATWFQITLHDVRFSRDSIYERICKTTQFIVFVGLALVGSKFEPNSAAKGNANFTLLCYVLILSRSMLAVQYLIVLISVIRKGFTKLYFPLSLSIGIYVLAALIFALMVPFFAEGVSHPGIFSVWWIVLFLEGVGTITISSFWRMLSFKKTHLVERMGLLTLIVIGEGAIGLTKTVSRMMGKHGMDPEGTALVMCIILVLVFVFMQYFDNHPHGHYGTIRQQIWALLHFPFQLAVVGVVEGSQQIAVARYIMESMNKFQEKLVEYCVEDQYEGANLLEKLVPAINYFQFDAKPECLREVMHINAQLDYVANLTGVCQPGYTETFPNATWVFPYPPEFGPLVTDIWSGLSISMGIELPVGTEPAYLMLSAWKTVYIYFWSSMVVLFACIICFLCLVRKNKPDLFDWVSIGGRGVMLSLCGMLLALVVDDSFFYKYLWSGMILPTVVIMLATVLIFDHFARVICNWRLRRRGYEPPVEDNPHHSHPHSDSDSVEVQRETIIMDKKRLSAFRSTPSPRPSSAVYVMGNFAASLASLPTSPMPSPGLTDPKDSPVLSPRLAGQNNSPSPSPKLSDRRGQYARLSDMHE